ncbi:MAG: kynureninase [Planctomycetes bacterium]|nr:kynureninase [Planctomycetota bacterium]
MTAERLTPPASKTTFRADESFARQLDEGDPLADCRDRFHIPRKPDGGDATYLAGNSLGLAPKAVRSALADELDDWARLAVDAHFQARTPWYSYHEVLRESAARLVGAMPGEVVMMNGLTVNLHLLMVTFYRPTRDRYKIVMEDCAFPSDTYAIRTQLRHHGLDPDEALIIVRPRDGEYTLRTEDIESFLEREGSNIALLWFGGVNYFTGQVFDMGRIAAAAKSKGCVVGFDLAHAAGNVILELHKWDVDFAVWCTYKYLNCGPGSVAGAFVHEKHGRDITLPRFGGWWGNDPDTRFRMHLQPEFVPQPGADGWQVSNPPILSLAALKASLAIFDEVGMQALRDKSERLTGYLQYLIDRMPSGRYEVITPRETRFRGCQLSILVHDRPQELFDAIRKEGVVCDFREPNVIRAAPTPLYNTYHDVWDFARVLGRHK